MIKICYYDKIFQLIHNFISILVLLHSSAYENMKIDKKGYKGDSLGMLLLIGFLTGIAATICGIMNLSVTKREEIAERDFIRTGGLNIMCITLLLLGMYKIDMESKVE